MPKKLLTLFLSLVLLFVSSCDQPPSEVPAEILKQGVNPADGLITPVIEKAKDTHTVKLTATPAAVDFGTIMDSEQLERSIGLTNHSNDPVILESIQLFGASQDFSLQGTCHKNLTLAPHSTCSLQVTYAPLDAKAHQAEILVQYQHGAPAKMTLQGTAEVASPLPPHPASLQALRTNIHRRALPITIHKTEALPDASMVKKEPDDHYPKGMFQSAYSSLPVDRSRILTADRYIPAVLENTINSELSGGRIIAVVERNVYGSDGRFVLIPASSRVIGHYMSLRKQGDTRLAVKWQRIIRPDGASIALQAQGADAMGRLGLIGTVDRRFFHKYGSSILTSLISTLPEYFIGGEQTSITSNNSTTNQTSGKGRAVEHFSKDMSFLARRMIEENLHLEPVVTIPQGTRLLIVPSEDIYLTAMDNMVALTDYTKVATAKLPETPPAETPPPAQKEVRLYEPQGGEMVE